jgi:hypothetical protein
MLLLPCPYGVVTTGTVSAIAVFFQDKVSSFVYPCLDDLVEYLSTILLLRHLAVAVGIDIIPIELTFEAVTDSSPAMKPLAVLLPRLPCLLETVGVVPCPGLSYYTTLLLVAVPKMRLVTEEDSVPILGLRTYP